MIAPLKLVEVTDSEALRQILALRVVAWRPFIEIDADVHEWTDRYDATGRHWAIFDGDRIVAAARLSIHERLCDVPDSEVYVSVLTMPVSPPLASMNRLVVHPEYRGRGLSDKLDEIRISTAEGAGCTCVFGHTHAGDKRVAQLVREGFQALGTGRRNTQGILKGLAGVIFYRPLPRLLTPAVTEVIGCTSAL